MSDCEELVGVTHTIFYSFIFLPAASSSLIFSPANPKSCISSPENSEGGMTVPSILTEDIVVSVWVEWMSLITLTIYQCLLVD